VDDVKLTESEALELRNIVLSGASSRIYPAVERIVAARVEAARAETRREAPKVEIVETLGKPTACKVWRRGVLVFSGQTFDAALASPVSSPAPDHAGAVELSPGAFEVVEPAGEGER